MPEKKTFMGKLLALILRRDEEAQRARADADRDKRLKEIEVEFKRSQAAREKAEKEYLDARKQLTLVEAAGTEDTTTQKAREKRAETALASVIAQQNGLKAEYRVLNEAKFAGTSSEGKESTGKGFAVAQGAVKVAGKAAGLGKISDKTHANREEDMPDVVLNRLSNLLGDIADSANTLIGALEQWELRKQADTAAEKEILSGGQDSQQADAAKQAVMNALANLFTQGQRVMDELQIPGDRQDAILAQARSVVNPTQSVASMEANTKLATDLTDDMVQNKGESSALTNGPVDAVRASEEERTKASLSIAEDEGGTEEEPVGDFFEEGSPGHVSSMDANPTVMPQIKP